MICTNCGTMLTVQERWCRSCGAPQDHRGEEAPENVSEYRRMLEELMKDGELADWQAQELQRLRRRMGVGEATHQKLLQEIKQQQQLPLEVYVDATPLAGLKVGIPSIARLRIINLGETTIFVQAAYGTTTTQGLQLTSAVRPLEEYEGTQLELQFTPEEYGHHQLEVVLSYSIQESGPYRQVLLTPVRLQVGRETEAGAPVMDMGQGEIRHAEWLGSDGKDDWRQLGLQWATAELLTAFEGRHRMPDERGGDPIPPTVRSDNERTLAEERQARAQAARMEARRVADVHHERQQAARDAYQQASRERMESWAQAEFWGRQQREQARRSERLDGLLRLAESHGLRFTDIPKPVTEEWIQWAEAQVMARVKEARD